MNPIDASTAVLATGLLALWMGLTDAMLKYLKPGMRPWLVIAGALLVATGAYGLLQPRRLVAEGKDRAPDGHGHHHHQRVGWLVVVPIFALIVLGQEALGAYAASRAPTRGLPPYAFDIPNFALAHGEPATLELVDVYQGASQHGNRVYLARHDVRLDGFVTKNAALGPNSFVLTRFLVSCCAADATPIRIGIIDVSHIPKVGKWVEVTARLDPSFAPRRGGNPSIMPTVTMRLRSMKTIDAPSEPYESLR